MRSLSRNNTSIIIFFAGLLLFVPFLGAAHLFDWDEVNFAECAREMIKTSDYSRVYMNFHPFYEKPPLFFWMQAASMHLFGVNEFAARFPNAICGIVTLIVLYHCGKKIFSRNFGIGWSLAYGGSFFPSLYFKAGIIDPWFNLFIILSLYSFILYHWKYNGVDKEGLKYKPSTYAILSGIFMGLAILTKGPVAFLVFILVLLVYLVLNRFRLYFHIGHAFLFLGVTLFVTSLWYGYETMRHGTSFIVEFIKYQFTLLTTHAAGQKGFLGYHFIVVFFGCFPASIFALPSLFKSNYAGRYEKDIKKWMLILLWVVLILFTFTQSRIIHYSSLAWFPVTFLAAYTFYKWEKKEMAYKKYTGILITCIGSLLSLLFISFPFVGMSLKKIIPHIKDKFTQANLQADVHWTGLESLAGVILLIAVIVGITRLRRNDWQKAKWFLFGGTAVTVFLIAAIFIPKIERYSQGAAIDFLIQRRGEDCYVDVLGYYSYTQYFYPLKEKPAHEKAYNQEWLLLGDIDKPAYFVTRIDRLDRFPHPPDLKELYEKNGFIFYKRDVPGKEHP